MPNVTEEAVRAVQASLDTRRFCRAPILAADETDLKYMYNINGAC